MLVLSKKDIEECVSILDVLEAVEEAFMLQESGNYLMPDRMHVEKDGNILLLMPAFSDQYFSTKLVSVFPENMNRGEPSIYGSVLLNDASNGKPLALLEGSILTGLRTGAVGGLATAFTTPKDTNTLGLIGAGFQGFFQVLFACTVRNISTINIFDPFSKRLEAFVDDLKKYLPHPDYRIVSSAEELLRDSELIITATTSQTPVIPNNKEMLKGKHFIGLGSFTPAMREFPDGVIKLSGQAVVDTDLAKQESGDLSIPLENGIIAENQIFRLGQLITGEKEIDITDTTFFKSVGMALFDLLTAEKIYNNAIEKDLGTQIDL